MINFKNNILYIGDKKIHFNYKIDKVLDINGIFIVFLLEHNTDISNIPLNNVYAVDFGGNILWQINDIIKGNKLYTGIRINDLGELVVNSFAGVAYKIDPINKEVKGDMFTK